MAQTQYKYYITDNTNSCGMLIEYWMHPNGFLLLLGQYVTATKSFDDVQEWIESELEPHIMNEDIDFAGIKDKYNYDIYDLIKDGHSSANGCVYCNLDEIKAYYSGDGCKEVLNSFDISKVVKNDIV